MVKSVGGGVKSVGGGGGGLNQLGGLTEKILFSVFDQVKKKRH